MGNTLANKVAVVTGSGRGIGRAIAVLLAEEGASVVVNDLGGSQDGKGQSAAPADEVAAEIRAKGGKAVANFDSVATMDGGQRIIQAALDTFGRIDILVNNAGVFWLRPFVELTEREWDTVFDVHVKGHFACIKAALPHMIKQRSGRIINTSSGAALGAGYSVVHYSAAKAAILGLTRSLAREVGKHGITVNAVMPLAATRLQQGVPSGTRMPAHLVTSMPEPEDSAPIYAFLASDAAAGINGVTLACRMKGAVQRMSDPVTVESIYKEGRWTPAELLAVVPRTLASGLVNPDPPQP